MNIGDKLAHPVYGLITVVDVNSNGDVVLHVEATGNTITRAPYLLALCSPVAPCRDPWRWLAVAAVLFFVGYWSLSWLIMKWWMS